MKFYSVTDPEFKAFGRVLDIDVSELIATAETQLMTMDPANPQYAAIVNAAAQLQSLIDSGTASQTDITNAMTTLTRAMAGIY